MSVFLPSFYTNISVIKLYPYYSRWISGLMHLYRLYHIASTVCHTVINSSI